MMNNAGTWIDEITIAFRALGGAARYDDLYEFIERTTVRTLSKEWKASVRRTIEDHSSHSKNWRSVDLFEHLDRGFWGLREFGDVSAMVERRAKREPKAVVDEILETSRPEGKNVFVQEHWRQWPRRNSEPITLKVQRSVAAVTDAWITDRCLELLLKNHLIISMPLDRYGQLSCSEREDLRNLQVGEFGVFWPSLGFQLSISDILLGGYPK